MLCYFPQVIQGKTEMIQEDQAAFFSQRILGKAEFREQLMLCYFPQVIQGKTELMRENQAAILAHK